MLDVNKLNDDVISDIMNNMQLDDAKDESYKELSKLSFEQAWRRYCIWNGLLGSFHLSLAKAYENLKSASDENDKRVKTAAYKIMLCVEETSKLLNGPRFCFEEFQSELEGIIRKEMLKGE